LKYEEVRRVFQVFRPRKVSLSFEKELDWIWWFLLEAAGSAGRPLGWLVGFVGEFFEKTI
jgi:hypothetical protein